MRATEAVREEGKKAQRKVFAEDHAVGGEAGKRRREFGLKKRRTMTRVAKKAGERQGGRETLWQ